MTNRFKRQYPTKEAALDACGDNELVVGVGGGEGREDEPWDWGIIPDPDAEDAK